MRYKINIVFVFEICISSKAYLKWSGPYPDSLNPKHQAGKILWKLRSVYLAENVLANIRVANLIHKVSITQHLKLFASSIPFLSLSEYQFGMALCVNFLSPQDSNVLPRKFWHNSNSEFNKDVLLLGKGYYFLRKETLTF